MTLRSLPNETILFIVFATSAALVYRRILNGALDITAGFLFLTAAATAALILVEIAMRIVRLSVDTRRNVRVLVVTLVIVAFGVEMLFRFGLRTHYTYPEENGRRPFESLFEEPPPTWFHSLEYGVEHQEFSHVRTRNSLGLAERELPPAKSSDEYRIIALGDSYTEGVGTVYDSTWVKALERNLTAALPNRRITTINAGIAGSDVFFEYMLLHERLLSVDPDLVIVAINTTDVYDIAARGGMERFQPDGSTMYSVAPPSWEWLYGISFIFRHVVHDLLRYDWLFMTPHEIAKARRDALSLITSAVDAFADLSQEAGFGLLIVTHPQRWEVRVNNYNYDFGDVVSYLEGNAGVASIDLLDYYTAKGIMNEENASEFYWPVDGHHTGPGYQAMGDAIADAVKRLQLISN